MLVFFFFKNLYYISFECLIHFINSDFWYMCARKWISWNGEILIIHENIQLCELLNCFICSLFDDSQLFWVLVEKKSMNWLVEMIINVCWEWWWSCWSVLAMCLWNVVGLVLFSFKVFQVVGIIWPNSELDLHHLLI